MKPLDLSMCRVTRGDAPIRWHAASSGLSQPALDLHPLAVVKVGAAVEYRLAAFSAEDADAWVAALKDAAGVATRKLVAESVAVPAAPRRPAPSTTSLDGAVARATAAAIEAEVAAVATQSGPRRRPNAGAAAEGAAAGAAAGAALLGAAAPGPTDAEPARRARAESERTEPSAAAARAEPARQHEAAGAPRGEAEAAPPPVTLSTPRRSDAYRAAGDAPRRSDDTFVAPQHPDASRVDPRAAVTDAARRDAVYGFLAPTALYVACRCCGLAEARGLVFFGALALASYRTSQSVGLGHLAATFLDDFAAYLIRCLR